MSSRVMELQKAMSYLETARALVKSSDKNDKNCPIRGAIRYVEDLLTVELDEAPRTPTAQTVRLPTVPPSK